LLAGIVSGPSVAFPTVNLGGDTPVTITLIGKTVSKGKDLGSVALGQGGRQQTELGQEDKSKFDHSKLEK
jgi:hypothetical protein